METNKEMPGYGEAYFQKPNWVMTAMCVFLFMLFTFNGYSQIQFEHGYLVDSTGRKVECLIKDNDWKYNPTSFKYKLSENSELQTGTVESVQEFTIVDQAKYVSRLVQLDRSGKDLKDMSVVRNPEFIERQLFLKVLLEGSANLYAYEDVEGIKYFYKKGGDEIHPLIFKNYRTQNGSIAENNTFRQQLLNALTCASLSERDFLKLDYSGEELMEVFTAYSKCNDVEAVSLEKQKAEEHKDMFNLTLRPGLNYSVMTIENPYRLPGPIYYGSKINWRVGVELEFILPFNRNKWAFVIEPNYNYYKSNKQLRTRSYPRGGYNSNIQIQEVEIPISIRHYFFLSDASRLFVEGSLIKGFAFDSYWKSERDNPLTLSSGLAIFGFGIGYKLHDKYRIGMRFKARRSVFSKYMVWNSKYDQVVFMMGYTLF